MNSINGKTQISIDYNVLHTGMYYFSLYFVMYTTYRKNVSKMLDLSIYGMLLKSGHSLNKNTSECLFFSLQFCIYFLTSVLTNIFTNTH